MPGFGWLLYVLKSKWVTYFYIDRSVLSDKNIFNLFKFGSVLRSTFETNFAKLLTDGNDAKRSNRRVTAKRMATSTWRSVTVEAVASNHAYQ